MALVARPISDALQLRQNMAGLGAGLANGKRKAPVPSLPTGVSRMILTLHVSQTIPPRHVDPTLHATSDNAYALNAVFLPALFT